MVKNSFLALFAIAILALLGMAGTNKAYSDTEIFVQAEAMSLQLGMPADTSELASVIDPAGQIIRTTECSWLYGRPKNDQQNAIVICEFQSKIVGRVYTAEDGVITANWYVVVTPRNAPQIAGLLEQLISNPEMAGFRKIVIRELQLVRSMTFIASRERGVIFPTPSQFQP